jgi:hypothetical protein
VVPETSKIKANRNDEAGIKNLSKLRHIADFIQVPASPFGWDRD